MARPHVLAALAEHDRLGSREFLSRYRFGRAKAYTLWHDGREYDSKAVLGVAYLHATGRVATREEFRGGETGAAAVLRKLGFDVVADEQALESLEQEERLQAARAAETAARNDTPPARRAPRKATRKAARPKPAERPVRVCPTCYTALPATGVCDFCD